MTASTDQERVSLPLDLVNDLLALCTPEDHELRERVKQAARRAQVVPKWWKLVPEEPTPAMYDRVMRDGYYHDDPKAVKAVLRAEYQDMLAAAPQPPDAAPAQDHGEVQRLRDALETIAAYPYSRDQEMGATAMRKVARDALAAQKLESNE